MAVSQHITRKELDECHGQSGFICPSSNLRPRSDENCLEESLEGPWPQPEGVSGWKIRWLKSVSIPLSLMSLICSLNVICHGISNSQLFRCNYFGVVFIDFREIGRTTVDSNFGFPALLWGHFQPKSFLEETFSKTGETDVRNVGFGVALQMNPGSWFHQFLKVIREKAPTKSSSFPCEVVGHEPRFRRPSWYPYGWSTLACPSLWDVSNCFQGSQSETLRWQVLGFGAARCNFEFRCWLYLAARILQQYS